MRLRFVAVTLPKVENGSMFRQDEPDARSTGWLRPKQQAKDRYRMTPEPRIAPLVPSYGTRTLAELGASILASVSGSGTNVLGLPEVRRVCLLIVDGLGWELLRAHPAAAPFLSELAMNARPLTAGVPATTVTSLTTLGTGLPPGQHGALGYQVVIPGQNRLLNGLRWDDRIDPEQWQPQPTIYERAVAADIAAYDAASRSFRRSGRPVRRCAARGTARRTAWAPSRVGRARARRFRERDRDRLPWRPRRHRARLRRRVRGGALPAHPRESRSRSRAHCPAVLPCT